MQRLVAGVAVDSGQSVRVEVTRPIGDVLFFGNGSRGSLVYDLVALAAGSNSIVASSPRIYRVTMRVVRSNEGTFVPAHVHGAFTFTGLAPGDYDFALRIVQAGDLGARESTVDGFQFELMIIQTTVAMPGARMRAKTENQAHRLTYRKP